MNRQEANELRASMGLAPLPAVAHTAQQRKRAANKAQHAQACRDLKSKRSKGGK